MIRTFRIVNRHTYEDMLRHIDSIPFSEPYSVTVQPGKEQSVEQLLEEAEAFLNEWLDAAQADEQTIPLASETVRFTRLLRKRRSG